MTQGIGRNRVRSARRRVRLIGKVSRATPKREPDRQVKRKETTHLYAELIQITRSTLDQTNQAAAQLSQQKSNLTAQGLILQLHELRPLVERIIDQTARRVLQGETVPAQEKVASLCEPHPDYPTG